MFKPLLVLGLVAELCSIAVAAGPLDTPTIIGTWETIDRHLAMGSLYQPVHGVRKREGIMEIWQEGDQLKGCATHEGHAAITHQERWKDGRTEFRTVSFDAGKLRFEFEIDEWFITAGPLVVESGGLPNKGLIRVEAVFKGERLLGTWGMFLADGTEAFRGEWEAWRENKALSGVIADETKNGATTEAAKAPGPVMLIGGSHQDLTPFICRRFFDWAGGTNGKIVVIPTGIANPENPETAKEILKPWRDLQPQSVQILHTRDRKVADDPAFVKPLTEATAVFFTNGHRDRIFDAYRGTQVQRELKNLHERGGLIGGTGTGSVVLGDLVVDRGSDDGLAEPGLAVVPGFVIEDRKQPDEFSHAMRAHTQHIGLIVDPGTAVFIRRDKLRVLGEATASVFLSSGSDAKANRCVLTAGGQLDVIELHASVNTSVRPN